MNDETKMDADINGRQRDISGQVIRRCPLVAGGTLYKNEAETFHAEHRCAAG